MVAQDIVDYLDTTYPNRNWGFDTIRWISSMAGQSGYNITNLHKVFRNLGTCESKRITSVSDLDLLLDCYLVWYKKKTDGKSRSAKKK